MFIYQALQLKLKRLAMRAEEYLDRLLVIGSTGLLGSKIASIAASRGFVAYNTGNTRQSSLANSVKLDITDRKATLRLVKAIRPRVIVNTAALTNVDYCETHREEAERVNVGGVRNLVEAAQESGCRLVQVSTDSVFDGERGDYAETDTPHPLNQYSKTKLDSERIVLELPSCAVARTAVIYGWHSPETQGISAASAKTLNFALFVLDRLRHGQTVKAIRDQYTSPTFSDNLAEAVLRLAKHTENGIFHTAGKSCISRYEFAVRIAEVFGYPPEQIQSVISRELAQIAVRPKNSCLIVEKAERTLGMRFLTVDEGLSEMRKSTAI